MNYKNLMWVFVFSWLSFLSVCQYMDYKTLERNYNNFKTLAIDVGFTTDNGKHFYKEKITNEKVAK